MAEAFDEWKQPKLQTPLYGYHKYFDEWSARDMAAMIERDRNHPSIVLWSAGNEMPDQSDPHGPETLQGLLDIMRSKDPTRMVTCRMRPDRRGAQGGFAGVPGKTRCRGL